MIAATLLRSRGVFTKVGLRCETCEADPERRAYLGCGEPPSSGWRPDDMPCEVDRVAYAAERYAYANTGDVSSRLGFLWPWCPRWFARENSFLIRRILIHARYLRTGDHGAVRGRATLTGAGERWIDMAHQYSEWLTHEEMKNG